MISKTLLLSLCCVFLQANIATSQDLTLNFAQNGLKSTKNMFEKNLKSVSFWNDFLKDKFVDYGYYEKPKTLLLSSKDSKILYLVEVSPTEINLIKTFDTIIGGLGNKVKEGDLKTPVGVYEINKKFIPKDGFYGPLAYETSYPNLYDRLGLKTGYGIWIHGYPLDGSKRDPMSKGCIVLKNSELTDLAKNIKNIDNLKLIIYEKGMPRVDKNDIELILANLYSWKYAWEENNLEEYLDYYHKDFLKSDKKNLKEFKKYKKRIFDKKENKTIKISDINILPYPNLKNHKMFRITFLEDYKSESYKFYGMKELYVKIDDTMKIIVEK
ncbi:MAG: FIG00638667: hypothetical protein [uncultured Campylobacterales bacterium]|uniref:L,D-TPase catalytic domain-containing protein n=1 Tax=uncultured Campylobacterales bacterium TaxID=352960 RepID=A0A6S6T8Z2_9BACT|nr:MAG: FIG00638667: hypothetical protein [uncultured Campylobacterales bacterium]